MGTAMLVSLGLATEPTLPLLPYSTEARAVVGSEEGRVVAEAWKVLDRAFYDANFNGVDWRAVSCTHTRIHLVSLIPSAILLRVKERDSGNRG